MKDTTEGRTVTLMAASLRLRDDPEFGVGLFKAIPVYLKSGEIKVSARLYVEKDRREK